MDHHHALTQLAFILAAAFIGGAVLKKLKQPALVGYIIVGVILGPSVFGVVEEQQNISFMAELGILLLLFLAAMELDLHNFKAVARVSVGTCLVQIAIGLASMFAFGFFMGWPVNLCILLGFAVSLSSTAVALKILDDGGLRTTRIGDKSIGILVSQDIAVIPMILIIGALSTAEGFHYMGLVKLAVALLAMIGIIALFTKKPKAFSVIWEKFEKLHDFTMQGQTAVTGLALCFVSAALAGLFGLSAAYGAFLAGLVIGNTFNHKMLEAHTKPIFEVMIMIFFLSIGLLIDLDFLKQNFVTILSLLFITTLLKTIVNIATLRLLGVEKNEAFVVGAVLGQVGEFGFILAAMGLATDTINDEGYKFVLSIISLSLLVTPLWLYLVKRYKILDKMILKHRNKSDPDSWV